MLSYAHVLLGSPVPAPAASRGIRVLIFTGIYKLFVSIWNELALKRQAKMVFAHVTRQTWHQGQNAMGGLCHGISFCHPSAGCLQCAAHELWLSLRSARWTPDCVASQASTEVTTHASLHSTRYQGGTNRQASTAPTTPRQGPRRVHIQRKSMRRGNQVPQRGPQIPGGVAVGTYAQ